MDLFTIFTIFGAVLVLLFLIAIVRKKSSVSRIRIDGDEEAETVQEAVRSKRSALLQDYSPRTAGSPPKSEAAKFFDKYITSLLPLNVRTYAADKFKDIYRNEWRNFYDRNFGNFGGNKFPTKLN